ncbi:hypothetical protein Tco_1289302 [Tanacetum coccineum]
MGRSTDTLRLLTTYAKIPKVYRAFELCDKNEQLHVFDSEETPMDAEKSQLKMNEFQKDEKVQELKIQPIDYEKLNKLYKDFVPQKELSAEQTYFSSSSIPCVKDSVKILETKSMPSESPLIKELYNIKVGFEKLSLLIKQNSKRASIFYTSPAEIERIEFCQKQVKPILNELQVYLDAFQDLFHRDIKEMKDAFEQNDVYLDEIENQNDLLKDQLLEASLTEDIKNLVITSCVEIRNKDLHDEIERISKESKDVSNESKTVDTACNDAFEVKQELSKRIVELEKDLSKSEAKVQRSKVEIKQCDEVKVKDDFDEIETKNIELEYRVASLIKENEHLKLTYKNLFDSIKKSRVQTKTSNVTQDEAENLKSQLFEFAETKFKNILEKIEFFKKKQLDISELNKGSGENVCDNAKCELQTKIVELEKVLTQQTKDFNDIKLELSNITAKFEAYFE